MPDSSVMIQRSPSDPEAGFTLIELIVAMSLSIIVLLAALQSLDLFSANAARQTKRTFANDKARVTVDRVVDDLRGAATVRVAAATNLAYSVSTAAGQRSERLCVGGTPVSLYRYTSTTATTPAAACGAADAGWSMAPISALPATTTTAFTYDGAASSTAPATVRAVGLTLNFDATAAGKAQSSTIRASASLRRATEFVPLGQDAFGGQCNSSGALLTLDAVATKGVDIAGVSYATASGASLGVGSPTQGVQIAKGITNVVATITSSTGVTQLIQKVIECT